MRYLPLILLPWLVAACAQDKDPAVTPLTQQSMDQRFNSSKPIRQNANGEWPAEVSQLNPMGTKRESTYAKGKAATNKTFKTNEYAKTSWWGRKAMPKTTYDPHTSTPSQYQSASRHQGQGATEAGATASMGGTYKTGDYRTAAAHESKGKAMPHTSDAETDIRRRVYPEPDINTVQQQRQMNIKATRQILGRE